MFGGFFGQKAAKQETTTTKTKKSSFGKLSFFGGSVCGGETGDAVVDNVTPTGAADPLALLGPPPTPPTPPKPQLPPQKNKPSYATMMANYQAENSSSQALSDIHSNAGGVASFDTPPTYPPKVPPKVGVTGPAGDIFADPTPATTPPPPVKTPEEVLTQKLADKKISLDEYDHMSEQLYTSKVSSSMPGAWGTPEMLPGTLKATVNPLVHRPPLLTKATQADLQQRWTQKIQNLMNASIDEMNRPGLTNEEKAAVATKWLAVIQKMNRHTQRWLPDLEDHQQIADIKVAEAEDYKMEHPEPDRAFFIGLDEDY